MKLVSYRAHGETSVGVLDDSGYIIDIPRAGRAWLRESGRSNWEALAEVLAPRTMIGLLEAGEEGLELAQRAAAFARAWPEAEKEGARLALDQVTLLAPVPNPRKITCVGLNYVAHAQEVEIDLPKTPALFSEYATAVNRPGAPVEIPRVSDQVDWEGELAVVIGRRGRHIPESEAMKYVAGYTVFHDVSVRDYQMATGQWMVGKTFDGHAPMGPWLVLKDEIPDPHNLGIKTEVNGEVVQQSNTRMMIFKIPFLISYISQVWTLEPGDVLATGTPEGVGFHRNPPRFLKPGDVVRITIERIGTLENPFVAAS